jgi:hypothetical protein
MMNMLVVSKAGMPKKPPPLRGGAEGQTRKVGLTQSSDAFAYVKHNDFL